MRLKIIIIGLIVILATFFVFRQKSSTSSNEILDRLKKRVLDQDMPSKGAEKNPESDMNDVSTNSPSPGLNPY